MSIHMHDLQVQNEIISNNKITTKLLEAQNIDVNGMISAYSALFTSISGTEISSNGITIMSSESDGQRMRITHTAGSENQCGYIFVGDNQSAEAYRSDGLRINCRDFALVSGFNTSEAEKLKISYTEDGAISITASGYIILPDITIDGDCNVNGELSIGSKAILTDDHIGTLIPSPTGKGASGNWDINTTSANKLNTNAGNGNTPIYFKDGIPVVCNEVYAVTAKKLVDDTNNNLNAGSSTTPIYFNNGIPMECVSLGTNKLELHNNQDTIMTLLADPNLQYAYAEYYLPPDPEMGSSATTPILLSSRYIKGENNYTFGFDRYPASPSNGQIFFKLNTTQDGWVEATPYVYIQN